jgi:membrane-bound lytic murein transglycosylase A
VLPPAPDFRLELTEFAALPHWAGDDHDAALAAFRRSAARHLQKPYTQRAVPFDAAAFEAACRASLVPGTDAKGFFEAHFAPFHITPATGRGFVTGYYEPLIEARRQAGSGFDVPFLRRPDDLVELDDAEAARIGPRDADPAGARFARRAEGGLTAYPDRRAIETGALAGRGLELAFVRSNVDAFFAHVQGCARLQFPDGETRITYDGKSGHVFTGIGRFLADTGEIPLERVTMASIRDWLAAHPERADAVLWQNRSYIFFREAAVEDPGLGPVAAAKVPLTPGRSIAVDRTLHAFGLPFFMAVPQFSAFGDTGFHRLMVAQDTGSAIIGPARADLFIGCGDAAGAIAGAVRFAADMTVLLPVAEANRPGSRP